MIPEEVSYHKLLEELTENIEVRREVLTYVQNKFLVKKHFKNFPFQEEPYAVVWEEYCTEAEKKGVFETLKTHLVQFQFPIAAGISGSEEYRAAVYKGINTAQMVTDKGLVLNKPETLKLRIHSSIAGKLPVLIVPDIEDFAKVVQALSLKNEPKPIPATMGAAMINGINNWSRIRALKKTWMAQNPLGSWRKYFAEQVVPNKALYQDKLIVLSEKEYSGVSGGDLGISQREWKKLSIKIRLEHECAHFFTLRYFGAMANNMHDELIADYMGIRKAHGSFNPDWFLKCIGLEAYPNYRKGARFENYLGNPILSTEAFSVLRSLLKRATTSVYQFDQKLGHETDFKTDFACLSSLCSLNLLEIAGEEGVEKLYNNYEQAIQSLDKF